jgi:putative transposase
LLATSEGDLFGRGLLADLIRFDRQITAIARHRQRAGGKPRDSERYGRLVTRLRGMLETRINAALNRIVETRRPAALVIERLNFRSPDLSRRMNRIIQNCGRAVFKAKLIELEERFGIVAHEVPSAYTSQECSACGYVDRRNRRSQSEFLCRFCGKQKHSDVNGACTVTTRRSRGLGAERLTKGAILAILTRQHDERFPRSQGAAADPRLTNPYWSVAARNALTQDLVSCVQKK